jgi:hypothetical protein
MGRRQCWCRITVRGPDGAVLGGFTLDGACDPDLAAVDDVARVALQAARLGGRITLRDVSPAMRALLDLAGLGVEMEGQSEPAEQPPAVVDREEHGHPDDPAG